MVDIKNLVNKFDLGYKERFTNFETFQIFINFVYLKIPKHKI